MARPEGRHPWRAALAGLLLGVLVGQGVTLVLLWRSVPAYQAFWGRAHGRSGGLLYVALGDSAAQGIGASRPQRGYVGLLADDLSRCSRRPVRVVNLSVSGARVRDVDDQLAELRRRGLHPDLLTVDVGGNDVRTGYRAAVFRRDVDRMTAALPRSTVVLDVPWFMHGHWEHDALGASRVLTASARRRGLVVAPLQAALQSRGWASMLTLYAADLFHPDDEGHALWARTVWSVLPPALRDRCPTGPSPLSRSGFRADSGGSTTQ